MQKSSEGECRALWSKVSQPAQRALVERAGLEPGIKAPLQLNLSGPAGYAQRVALVLSSQKLPVYIFKTRGKQPKEIMPVVDLILMSKVSPPVPDDREGILFASEPSAESRYSQAIAVLVDRANRVLLVEQLTPIPRPPESEGIPKSDQMADSA
ncbi:MAG TPA: hypothetical protein VJG66_00595 [Patescibacteria group bacterium]|nr:hypothetical protein [Patescibacteria group bacterium]